MPTASLSTCRGAVLATAVLVVGNTGLHLPWKAACFAIDLGPRRTLEDEMWRIMTTRYFQEHFVSRQSEPGTGSYNSLDVTWSLLCLIHELG